MNTQPSSTQELAEQATGCTGAGGYSAYAERLGYSFIEVLDWTSSAGDWSFIISKDGKDWRILNQENRYPYMGFNYYISDEVYSGTAGEVLDKIYGIYA